MLQIRRDIFSIFFDIKVCCVVSLESPHRGDSNEYTQYTIFNVKKKVILNYPESAVMGFFQGTQERVRNSSSKRAISVRATEVLLYLPYLEKAITKFGLYGMAEKLIDATLHSVLLTFIHA